jgi:hypothetical protein
MKKIIIALLLVSSLVSAQESIVSDRKNEFRVDILSAILSSKLSISYERFLANDFSIGLNVNYSDSNKLTKDFEEGYTSNLGKYEINPYVRYALSKGKTSYYFAEVFASYNGGDYKEIVRLIDNNENAYYTTKTSTYTDIAAGGSLGYKIYFKESIALELLVGFGYNFLNTDKSPDKISRVGINLGYRF